MCPPPSFQLHDPEKITPTEFEGKTTFLGRFFPRKSVKDRPNESEHGQPAPRGWMPYSKPESEQASAKLWAIYVAEADRYDTALVESWRADMEGMLIFSGLFSGSLTAFLIESYRSLRPDSGEITIQLLAQISQQLAAVYNNTVFTPPETVHFEPANTSLVCNTLWFISLSLSITCALLATLVEQWAREFLHKTQKRPSPVTRARVLSFLYFGVRRFGMHTVVDVIPMLLHVSLVLFLAGLVAFLLPINHIMAGLVIAVLTVFLVFYAILTLFPSFTLASPYRTPFSDLIWNILHKIRSHLAPSSAAPCIGSTMNDAVVQIAVQHSETRDRRAIAWTLESLTDDHEFHAFLSAIPESIYGIKGFHLANDYLFPPILNGMTPDHRPLGERITQFVISARNMDPGGPMRRRRILDAMKAIWALGMVSGRNGTLFHRGDRVWFDVTMQAALKSPTHSDPDWPAPFAELASVAVSYSRANDLQNYISSVARMVSVLGPTLDRVDLVTAIEKIEDRLWALHVQDFPQAFTSQMDYIREWRRSGTMRDIGQFNVILNSMTQSAIWLEVNVTLLSRFLLRAACVLSEGGDLPSEYLHTCTRIVPRFPFPADTEHLDRAATFMPRPNTFRGVMHYLDPSLRLSAPTAAISDLDRIMQSFFRLLPLLRIEDVIPAFALYLSKRNHTAPMEIATGKCDLSYLMDCLVAALRTDAGDINILLAITAIIQLPAFNVKCWRAGRDSKLYDYMAEHHVYKSERFSSLSAVMTLRKLNHFLEMLPLDSSITAPVSVGPSIAEWHAVGAGSLLVGGLDGLDYDGVGHTLDMEIRRRIFTTMIISLTEFISACTQPIKPLYMSTTMYSLCRCLPAAGLATVEPRVMTDFARAGVVLVDHLMEHAQDTELNATIYALLISDGGPAKRFYTSEIANILSQALSRYLNISQESPTPEENLIGEIEQASNDLNRKMFKPEEASV